MPHSLGKRHPRDSLRPRDLTCLKPLPRHQADGSHYNEQVYCGIVGEDERQNGPYAVVRSSSDKARAMRNGLMLTACCYPEPE